MLPRPFPLRPDVHSSARNVRRVPDQGPAQLAQTGRSGAVRRSRARSEPIVPGAGAGRFPVAVCVRRAGSPTDHRRCRGGRSCSRPPACLPHLGAPPPNWPRCGRERRPSFHSRPVEGGTRVAGGKPNRCCGPVTEVGRHAPAVGEAAMGSPSDGEWPTGSVGHRGDKARVTPDTTGRSADVGNDNLSEYGTGSGPPPSKRPRSAVGRHAGAGAGVVVVVVVVVGTVASGGVSIHATGTVDCVAPTRVRAVCAQPARVTRASSPHTSAPPPSTGMPGAVARGWFPALVASGHGGRSPSHYQV